MRRSLLLPILLAGACASVPAPLVVDLMSRRGVRNLHQCVTEQLVDGGFAVIETRRDDGVITARREWTTMEAAFYGGTRERYDSVDVLIFERTSGLTGLQLRGATFVAGGERVAPSEDVRRLPSRIRSSCSDR